MATQYDPIAKDESLNTTEATPRNIADVLAEGLKGIEDALPPTYTEGDGIDISNNEISVDTTFAEASTRANIASGESFSTILGKIKKFFTDLKTVAFTGAYSDLSGTGNVAVKNSDNNFSANQTVNKKDGTTSSVGISALFLGNGITSGTAQNSRGVVNIYGTGSSYAGIVANVTANRVHTLPDKSGTIALTSDVNPASSSTSPLVYAANSADGMYFYRTAYGTTGAPTVTSCVYWFFKSGNGISIVGMPLGAAPYWNSTSDGGATWSGWKAFTLS